jgi:dethiobiotin synthetase
VKAGLFVAGTDTGVGKTLVAAALAHQTGLRALKPVATGFERMAGSDTEILCRAMGIAPTVEITPWRFAAPLSPDMAAAREARRIELTEVVRFCRAEGDVLVEGIGGVMTPLNERDTVLDWIVALGCPVVLVAGSYLGTLSHTLTAVAAMRARGIVPTAVIVSESPGDAPPLDETTATLRRFVEPVVALARVEGSEPWKTAPQIAAAAFCPLGKARLAGQGAAQ